jgi:hypothetical protein
MHNLFYLQSSSGTLVWANFEGGLAIVLFGFGCDTVLELIVLPLVILGRRLGKVGVAVVV